MFVPFLIIHCLLDFFFTRGLGFQKHQLIEMGKQTKQQKASKQKLIGRHHQENGSFGVSSSSSSSSRSVVPQEIVDLVENVTYSTYDSTYVSTFSDVGIFTNCRV
jgi:hypothetical protein